MHEAVHKSDIQYGNWWDEQICQGKEGIAQCNKGVNNFADGGRPCKVPDKISPPFSYMEEQGVFKSLDTIVNPLGLCRFYRTDPQQLVPSLQLALTELSACWRWQKILGSLS